MDVSRHPIAQWALAAAILILIIGNGRAFPQQPDPRQQLVKQFLSGQQVLVTYREGGPVYGTAFFLQVHFCASGRYVTFGQSRKHTVLDNEQVNNFTEQGTWEVTTIQGQLVLKSVPTGGPPNAIPVTVLSNGSFSFGESVTVIKQGPAQCR